jgi:hypothetical protein
MRSDLIELQLQSFRKHLKDEFEFVIFNNAEPDVRPAIHESINQVCRDLNIRCIAIQKDPLLLERCATFEYPQNLPLLNARGQYSLPGIGNEYSLCWAWQNFISKEKELACLMHSDVFLIADSKPSDILQRYDLCYNPQARPGIREYMWEVFVLFNMAKLPQPETINWMGGKIGEFGGDTSTQTSRYLEAHPDLRIGHTCGSVFFDDPSLPHSTRPVYEVIALEGKPIALHYTSASNWDNQSAEYHRTKTDWLRKVLAREEGVPPESLVRSGSKCYVCDCFHWDRPCPKTGLP